MKRVVVFCALCALWGCRQANTPETEPIALYYSTVEQSKTDLLTPGDEIGVFSNIEGTEHSFLENVPFVVGADGRSLSTAPAVYYPEAKQAVVFTAYLPFGGAWDGGLGTFSVPSDQTTAAALKQADFCWATASSTPVAAPVALEFAHKMARLLITTNEPTEKIAIPNAFSGGILDIKTGAFTNTLRSEVFTTGTELIVPAQPLTRLLLTVAGVEHPFTPAVPLDLPAGQTTTLSLTLNPITKTATLSGSSTTDWTTSAIQGNPTQAVSNVLTMHWPNYVPQGATPNKVVLTINNTDYTVSSGITHADQTFTVPFASSVLRYPYTITKIAFFRGSTSSVPACTQLLGATIYKSATQTLGIKDQGNAVLINGLWWATGNLVADGPNGCRIGAPTDCGLYFQFGSLIGYKGGSTGTGTGMPSKANGTYWNGGSWGSFAADAQVWPTNLSGTPSSWPQGATTNQWYFGLQSGWSTAGQNIRDFPGLAAGDLADKGVGDPCTYYLGGTWRLPTTNEIVALCNNQGGGGDYWLAWTTVGGSWTTSPTNGGNFSSNRLFIPASGYKLYSNGSFYSVSTDGYFWSSSVGSATLGFPLSFNWSNGVLSSNSLRSNGFPVRCVSSVP